MLLLHLPHILDQKAGRIMLVSKVLWVDLIEIVHKSSPDDDVSCNQWWFPSHAGDSLHSKSPGYLTITRPLACFCHHVHSKLHLPLRHTAYPLFEKHCVDCSFVFLQGRTNQRWSELLSKRLSYHRRSVCVPVVKFKLADNHVYTCRSEVRRTPANGSLAGNESQVYDDVGVCIFFLEPSERTLDFS